MGTGNLLLIKHCEKGEVVPGQMLRMCKQINAYQIYGELLINTTNAYLCVWKRIIRYSTLFGILKEPNRIPSYEFYNQF